jgi:hypothetical protein
MSGKQVNNTPSQMQVMDTVWELRRTSFLTLRGDLLGRSGHVNAEIFFASVKSTHCFLHTHFLRGA